MENRIVRTNINKDAEVSELVEDAVASYVLQLRLAAMDLIHVMTAFMYEKKLRH